MISTIAASIATNSSKLNLTDLGLETTNNTSNYFVPSSELYSNNTNVSFANGSLFNNNDLSGPVLLPSYLRTTSMVFCIVIMCLGVIGNVMVPIVIFKTKDMRNSTNIFLVNLSVADLMVLLVCTPTVLVEVNTRPETWVLGREMCKAVPFVELTVAHASVLTILAISFERYYAICKPLKAGYICTKARASFICLLAWCIAAIFTSPMLAITQYGIERYPDGSLVFVCFSSVEHLLPCLFFIGSVIVFFICPLAVLICIYALIAKTLMEHPNSVVPSIGNVQPKSGTQSVIKYRKQVILMLGTVVLAFFICLLPFRALTLWIIVAPAGSSFITSIGLENYYNILYFSRVMFHINSAINPILYNIMSSKFRAGFLKLCGMRNKYCKGRNEIARKSTTSSMHTHSHSQQTTETTATSLLNGGKRSSSRIREFRENHHSSTSSSHYNNNGDAIASTKEFYVRAPCFAVINGIGLHKLPTGEIYV